MHTFSHLSNCAGRLHYNVLAVLCNCECEPATLLRYGYWATTPNSPCVIISISLLRQLHTLMLECAVSVKGFIQTLRWTNNWSEGEV